MRMNIFRIDIDNLDDNTCNFLYDVLSPASLGIMMPCKRRRRSRGLDCMVCLQVSGRVWAEDSVGAFESITWERNLVQFELTNQNEMH